MRPPPLSELLPPWSSRIRPYPPGKPVEEVERELGRSAIKLASNENPLGPSPKALSAIRGHLDRVHLYPDGNGYNLRERLAEQHALEMNQIILGAGSTDLIELVAKTFLTAGDEGVVSESSFYIYRIAIEEMGAGLTATPMRENTCDLIAIKRALTQRTKVVYLGNPNNPTGTMFTAEELDRSKNRMIADAVYAQDNQSTLARWYGAALTTGSSVKDVETWPDRIRAVTAEQVQDAARRFSGGFRKRLIFASTRARGKVLRSAFCLSAASRPFSRVTMGSRRRGWYGPP